MLTAILGVVICLSAAVCGFAVYRAGGERPVFRAVVTFSVLLGTPVVTFWFLAVVLTSELPVIVAVLPLGLVGVGLYLVAEGRFPFPRGQKGEAG